MNNNTPYVVNYSTVANSSQVLPAISKLAKQLQKSPYLSLGDYMQELTDAEVFSLLSVVEASNADIKNNSGDNYYVQQIVLLTLMLRSAEGLEFFTPGVPDCNMYESANVLCSIIAGESLTRKGLVNSYYENMTLDPSAVDTNTVFEVRKSE